MRPGLQAAALVTSAAILLSACGGGGGGTPGATPTPVVTPDATAACPTAGSLPSSVAVGGAAGGEAQSASTARRAPSRAAITGFVPGTIAVTYLRRIPSSRIDAAAGRLQAQRVSDLDFDALGLHTRVVRVDPSQVDAAIAQMKTVSGVQSVTRIAYRQHMTISSNDPYFDGFAGTSSPYFENGSTPGQWDMHITNVLQAWNDVRGTAPVVGSAAPIAIVDTGVDVTHPELTGGKITRTRCFVTFPTGSAQTTSQFVTDTDGHGTNVAGIAAGDSDNGLGFASESFDAKIMAYRIFPSDPAAGCSGANPPAQCLSDSADEASAINDAVNNGAKVINLSLGGSPPCSTSDPEYTSVENAIAKNVVVVAAAGNGNSAGQGVNQLDCPAADPGVIAAGASAVNDSVPTVTAQKVASYSNYLLDNGTSQKGAYLVAPGGDPSGSTDSDNLHWIEHIYSSTAVQPGTCGPDFMAVSGNDCRILIAGTSQATPHIAGAAALVFAVRPSYTPAQVATALCSSAKNINDSKQGCGQLDAAAAVTYAINHP